MRALCTFLITPTGPLGWVASTKRPSCFESGGTMTQGEFREAEERAYRELAERLIGTPAFVETLPEQEQRVAEMVAEGRRPYEIAMDRGISVEAVWTIVQALSNAILAPSQGIRSRGYETAGLGSDTDPGVTGGYGETGFGALGTEEPPAVTEEPEEEK